MAVIMFSGERPGPNSVAGLTGWWRSEFGVYSDAGTTLAVDNDTVQQWNDFSGNSYTMSQATSTNRPTFKTNIVEGKPVVRFDGADNYMQGVDAVPNTLWAVNGATMMVAAFVHAVTTANATAYLNDSLWTDRRAAGGVRRAHALTTAPTATAFSYDGSEDAAAESATVTAAWLSFTYMHDGINVYSGVSDTRTASMTSAASGSTTALADRHLIFGANTDLSIFTQVDIAEIVAFNVALTEANRQIVERYFAAKYGITLPY